MEINLPLSAGQLLAKPLVVARALDATDEGVADELGGGGGGGTAAELDDALLELEATGGEAQELT